MSRSDDVSTCVLERSVEHGSPVIELVQELVRGRIVDPRVPVLTGDDYALAVQAESSVRDRTVSREHRASAVRDVRRLEHLLDIATWVQPCCLAGQRETERRITAQCRQGRGGEQARLRPARLRPRLAPLRHRVRP